MAKRKTFGQLTPRARSQAVNAGSQYGLTRKQVRDRYNRGTFNPFARAEPELRVPREFRGAAGEGPGGQIVIDWQVAAYNNYWSKLGPGSPKGETYQWNEFAVTAHTQDAPEAIQRLMALASEDELRAWSAPQANANGEFSLDQFELAGLPPIAGLTINDVTYLDDNGRKQNIFWYH